MNKTKKLMHIGFSFVMSSLLVFPSTIEISNNINKEFTDTSLNEDLTSGLITSNIVHRIDYRPVTNNEGYLSTQANQKEIYFNAYNGFTMWKLQIDNIHIKNMYKLYYPNMTDDEYDQLIFRYLLKYNFNGQELVVILTNIADDNTEIMANDDANDDFTKIKSRSNGLVFAVSLNTGKLFDPLTIGNNDINYKSISTTVLNGTRSLYENSSGDIIATTNGTADDRQEFKNQSQNQRGYRTFGYKNTTSKIRLSENGLSISYNIIANNNLNKDYQMVYLAPGTKNSNRNIMVMSYPCKQPWDKIGTSNFTRGVWEKYLYIVDDNCNIIEDFKPIKVGAASMDSWANRTTNEYVSRTPEYFEERWIDYNIDNNNNKATYYITSGICDDRLNIVEIDYSKSNTTPIVSKQNEIIADQMFPDDPDNVHLIKTKWVYSQTTNKMIVRLGNIYNQTFYNNKYDEEVLKKYAYKLGDIDFNNNQTNKISDTYFKEVVSVDKTGAYKRNYNSFSTPIVIDDKTNNSDVAPLIVTDLKNPNNNLGGLGQNEIDTKNGYTTIYAIPNYTKTKDFVSSENANEFRLNQFGYNDIKTELTTKYSSLLNKLPSQVTNNELKTLLNFNGNKPTIAYGKEGEFNITISDETIRDDTKGIINAVWNVEYQNFYNTDKKTIRIATDLDGFKDSANKYIKFITGTNGDANNDTKFNQINKLKTQKLPSEVVSQDIIDYFVDYNLLDKNGNQYKITTDDVVEIKADNSTGTLSVTIDVSNKVIDGLSNHINTRITQTYNGFKYISGYGCSVNNKQQIIETSNNFGINILNKYPNQISKQDIISYFMTLGDKLSRDVNDWDIQLTPNMYEGTLKISAKYLKQDNDIPDSITNKDIFELDSNSSTPNLPNATLTGLRTIQQDFLDANFSIQKAQSSNVVELFELYETAYNRYIENINSANKELYQSELLATELLRSLDTNLFFNKYDFVIKRIDDGNLDNISKITLQIEIKENAKANINKPEGNVDFEFNQTTKDYLDDQGISYVYQVEWSSVFYDQKFEWTKPNYIDNNYQIDLTADKLEIDLNKASYDGINKNMYANQVDIESLEKLINVSYFTVDEPSVIVDNNNGKIEVTYILTSSTDNSGNTENSVKKYSIKSSNNNVNEGNQIYKSITIIGFKKPINPIWLGLGISIALIVLVLLAVFALYLYFLRKNLRKTVGNQHDYSKLKKQDKDVKKDYQRLSKELSKRK